MSELSEQDWELVNAYHDGEMGAETRREFEDRLVIEPALAQALKDVREVSAGLAALRPSTVSSTSVPIKPAANRSWRPTKWLAGGAAAAIVATAVILGANTLAKPTALDIHEDFAKQDFVVGGGDLRAVAAGGYEGIPDLSSARLTPVAIRTLDTGLVTHYAGRNGCRFSYFRGAFESQAESGGTDRQIETWTTPDSTGHMIIASGMDQSRFDAIAAYLKLLTQSNATEVSMASVSDATTAAAPCVG